MDDALALAARWVLAVVLFTAGLRKLAQPQLADQLRRLRVPAPALAAGLLPASELVLALFLVVADDASWPALATVAMLGLFTGVVVANLSRGNAVPCPCFGAGEQPISAATVARNGWLIGLAVLATGSRGDASSWEALVPWAVLALITGVVIRRTG